MRSNIAVLLQFVTAREKTHLHNEVQHSVNRAINSFVEEKEKVLVLNNIW